MYSQELKCPKCDKKFNDKQEKLYFKNGDVTEKNMRCLECYKKENGVNVYLTATIKTKS